MTILAPNRRRGGPLAPRSGQRPPPISDAPEIIGLALGPRPSESDDLFHGPVRLSGTARLGAMVLLVLGLLVQRTMLPLLPWGPADLVTVLVAAVGLYAGPTAGCLGGFGIGLASDLVSDHALGRLAAVLCVVGYGCGMLASDTARRRWLGWLAVGGACGLAPLLFALTGTFVGDNRAAGMLLLTRCVAGLCYGLVLAPFVLFLVHRLLSPRTRGGCFSFRRKHSRQQQLP